MKRISFHTNLLILMSLLSFNVQASDFAKEKRWADQTVDAIMTGDVVWLKAGGHKFLSIYTKSTTKKVLGGAIVVHGIGVHPNWTDVIQPIRTRLPDAGWHTLSIQMPILSNEATHKEYAPLFKEIAPRMNAAVGFLKKKGVKNIVIIGHSMGATMSAYYISHNKSAGIKSLVTIGATGLSFKDKDKDFIQSLKKISVPILDLTGSDDLPEVMETSELKIKTAREAGNKTYHQVRIKGANHFLVGKEDELLKEITSWLRKTQ